MYESFYALELKPFSLTSNPSFLYLSQKHQDALAYLTYGIRERMGFIEITGEVGTGKTTICRAILNELDEKTKTAFIFLMSVSVIIAFQFKQIIILKSNIKYYKTFVNRL